MMRKGKPHVALFVAFCLFPTSSQKDGGLIDNYILQKNCQNNTLKTKTVFSKINSLAYRQAFKVETLPDYFLKENSNISRKSVLMWQISEGLDLESSVHIRTQNYFEHKLLSLYNLFFLIQIAWKPLAVTGLM